MLRAPLSSVARGSLVGLVVGLLIGGLGLLAVGAVTVLRGIDCAGLTHEECALEREIAASFARRQVWVGGALALMGLAVFMWARGRLARGRTESNES
jgi:hypothetical protein